MEILEKIDKYLNEEKPKEHCVKCKRVTKWKKQPGKYPNADGYICKSCGSEKVY